MAYRVFIASRSYGKYSPETIRYLEDNGCHLEYNQLGRVYREEDLLEVISEYDAIIVGLDEVTKKVISKGKKLRVIGKNGVGVDNIDIKAANEAGIYIVNTPGANSHSVADYTVGLMLSIGRLIPQVNYITKNGGWKRFIGRELWNKTVGIVGTGNIGQEVARRLKGFNCEILAYDIVKDEEFIRKYGVCYLELDELLQRADYVSIHLPLNKATRGLIDSARLSLMKKEAYIINTARGGIIDEDALYKALKDGIIAGAASDVFSEEPPGQHKLLELENFIATSHVGAFTYETSERIGMMLARDIIKVLEGKTPEYLVNNPVSGIDQSIKA
jgi:D-3-phosphoglycerate dehydrogenase